MLPNHKNVAQFARSKSVSIAVVIPCFKVSNHILNLISEIGDEISKIYIIDDCCPENTGKLVSQHVDDNRIFVIYHEVNQGVGGAVISGYLKALEDGADIIVKIDGDGQMDPALITKFIQPIIYGIADYTKGNRFFNLDNISKMPKIRIFGNAILSFLTKMSSGYWDLFDPTNGYTAIASDTLRLLPLNKISKGYFFESDMLFRLNITRAKVVDIPMDAKYEEETSNLKIKNIIFVFLKKNLSNFLKRIFYNYYLRGMTAASIELPIGLSLIITSTMYGAYHWIASAMEGRETPAGTVMIAALPIIIGFQLILAFISEDISAVPRQSLNIRNKYYSNGITDDAI